MRPLPPDAPQADQEQPSALPPGLPLAATPWNVSSPTPRGASPARGFRFDVSRLAATVAVAVVIAAVVLGGIGLDHAIAEPSAGSVSLGSAIANRSRHSVDAHFIGCACCGKVFARNCLVFHVVSAQKFTFASAISGRER